MRAVSAPQVSGCPSLRLPGTAGGGQDPSVQPETRALGTRPGGSGVPGPRLKPTNENISQPRGPQGALGNLDLGGWRPAEAEQLGETVRKRRAPAGEDLVST